MTSEKVESDDSGETIHWVVGEGGKLKEAKVEPTDWGTNTRECVENIDQQQQQSSNEINAEVGEQATDVGSVLRVASHSHYPVTSPFTKQPIQMCSNTSVISVGSYSNISDFTKEYIVGLSRSRVLYAERHSHSPGNCIITK